MAFTVSSMVGLANTTKIFDAALAGTAQSNVNTGSATIYLVQIDNSGNAAQKVYLKLYNNAAPTIGTTAPDIVIPAPGGSTQQVAIPEGVAFATALSMACVTTGGTGGTTSPTNPVAVTIVVTP